MWINIHGKVLFLFLLVVFAIGGRNVSVLQAANMTDGAYDPKNDGWYYGAGGTYYYISGEIQTGFQEIEGETYYFLPESGKMQTGLLEIEGERYYFHIKTGQMQTGWITIGKMKHYFSQANGQMMVGRHKIGTSAYYFDQKSGLKTSGWIKDGKKTYYADRKGVLKAGWISLNGKKYHFSSKDNNLQTGWIAINGKHYYFTVSGKEKGALQKNSIVGTKKTGIYYVDAKGIRVTSPEIMNAVRFVQKYASNTGTNAEKLKQCFQALQNYQYRPTNPDSPSAKKMSSYANDMFTQRQGNCYRYAASFACVAKILGYESRVCVGGVSSRGPGTKLSPHGWAEVKVNRQWTMCDISMQRGYPGANLYLCAAADYPFRLSCNARYALTVQDGVAFWK